MFHFKLSQNLLLLFFALFCTFYELKVCKKLFKQQQIDFDHRRCAEHRFAGRNTQHLKEEFLDYL